MGDTPVRTCLACRRSAAKPTLVRLVVASGSVTVDPHHRLSGRGAYLCDRPACCEAALARGGARLSRALRFRGAQVTVDEEAVRAGWRAARASAAPLQALSL